MSAQDNVEKVLRDMHVLISKSETYGNTSKIIVDKQEIFDLLNRLNSGIYEIMDEYEITKQSRDKAERQAHQRGDKIVFDSSRQAEDIYAASILYTNEALARIQRIMQDSINGFTKICEETTDKLKAEKETVHTNQSGLKEQLQDMIDTQKYLRLVEERNKQIEKEIEAEKNGGAYKAREVSPYANIKPEIKVNQAYFEKIGKPLETQKAVEEGFADAEDFDEPLSDVELDGGMQEFSSIEEAMAAGREEKKTEHFAWLKKEKKTQ